MSHTHAAQLELMNALNCIQTEDELNEFKDLLAHFFARKAQKAIDALWDEGLLNERTIEQWGSEHMSTGGQTPCALREHQARHPSHPTTPAAAQAPAAGVLNLQYQ